MRILALLLCPLLLASCSWRHAAAFGAAAAAGGLLIAKGKKDSDREKSREKERKALPVIDVNQTGTIRNLGGAIIDENHALHVTHWPVKKDQRIQIAKRSGGWAGATVKSKEDLGNDLAILYFEPALDLSEHDLLPIGLAQPGEPVTVERLNREPFATWVERIEGKRVKIDSDKKTIESGDSGKRRIQLIGGLPHVVSLNSTLKGWGPVLSDFEANSK